jgi:hypothetical protein
VRQGFSQRILDPFWRWAAIDTMIIDTGSTGKLLTGFADEGQTQGWTLI